MTACSCASYCAYSCVLRLIGPLRRSTHSQMPGLPGLPELPGLHIHGSWGRTHHLHTYTHAPSHPPHLALLHRVRCSLGCHLQPPFLTHTRFPSHPTSLFCIGFGVVWAAIHNPTHMASSPSPPPPLHTYPHPPAAHVSQAQLHQPPRLGLQRRLQQRHRVAGAERRAHKLLHSSGQAVHLAARQG